jgi:hypothetical protein
MKTPRNAGGLGANSVLIPLPLAFRDVIPLRGNEGRLAKTLVPLPIQTHRRQGFVI